MRVHRQRELCHNSWESMSTCGTSRVLSLNESRDSPTRIVTLTQIIRRPLTRTGTPLSQVLVGLHECVTLQQPLDHKQGR